MFDWTQLRGLDVNSYEGLIKCNVLPQRGLRIPLLPCHINCKLMFILCRTCAESTNCGICGYTRSERCIMGTWVSASVNTNVIIASYVTTHARLELYSYLERLEDRALYCDTDLIIYRHVEGMYNPPLSEFVGGMTDELGVSYITEYMSNGPKNYAYRTCDGKQVVKVKVFFI